MTNSRNIVLAAILALLTSTHVAHAQIADDNPRCHKDMLRGIVCDGNPPAVVVRERTLKIAVANESGTFDGFLAGVRYDHELRGTDHLAHAEFFMGRVSALAEERTIAKAELMGTFSMGKSYRPVVGIRSHSSAEISHPFTLITGVRLGGNQRHATLSLESGGISNRNNGDAGFETSAALIGYQSLSFLELDAAIRSGMGWGAGGAFTSFTVGAARRIGSQLKLKAEWSNERLSARGSDPAAGSNQLRVMLSAASWGNGAGVRHHPAIPRDTTGQSSGDDALVSAAVRERDLTRSHIHNDSGISAKNVFEGPPPGKKGSFGFGEVVECTYDEAAELGGNTPKFACIDPVRGKLKVKYGCTNGEVFGEVAATRLLWLLGFEADHMYPVIVNCKDCPPMPHMTSEELVTGHFGCAAIERKTGDAIASYKDQGWRWDELNKVSNAEGGASRAHIDALMLMAVILQHNDSKGSNQRMSCSDDEWSSDKSRERICPNPTLIMQDVGATFGGAGNRVRDDSSVDLAHWRDQMIWRDGNSCVANLAGSTNGGTIFDPTISEGGRSYLAALLMKVSAVQIRDLFRVAKVTIHDPGTTLAEWESAFWYKAWQIVNHRCAAE